MSHPSVMTPRYTALATELLLRLGSSSTQRDRIAFVYGYILAFDAMAARLSPREYIHYRNISTALHNIMSAELR